MMRLLYLMIISLIIPKKPKKKPKVRLAKKKEPIKFKLNIGFKFILGLTILIIISSLIVYYVYKTGALDTTGYYYRLDDL